MHATATQDALRMCAQEPRAPSQPAASSSLDLERPAAQGGCDGPIPSGEEEAELDAYIMRTAHWRVLLQAVRRAARTMLAEEKRLDALKAGVCAHADCRLML
jgi:hypothetical protein